MKFGMAGRSKQVVCLEHDQKSIEKAEHTIQSLGFTNIQQVLGSVQKIPFPDNSFDKVVCVSVLEHLPSDHLQAIHELQRVLKPGGKLLLTMDVMFKGKAPNDYYVDLELADRIIQDMGITKMRHGSAVIQTGNYPGDNIQFGVLFVLWVKPE